MHSKAVKTLVIALTLAVALAGVGCGDDDSGTGGSAGTGGASGSGATGGSGGDTTTCGATTCDAFPSVMFPETGPLAGLSTIVTPPKGCCTEVDNACGVANDTLLHTGACLERDAPGEPTSACPTEQLSAFGTPIPFLGCCRPDNRCGLLGSLMGIDFFTGCAERQTFAEGMAGSLAAGFLGAPPTWTSIPCTYGANGMDAGTEDSGD